MSILGTNSVDLLPLGVHRAERFCQLLHGTHDLTAYLVFPLFIPFARFPRFFCSIVGLARSCRRLIHTLYQLTRCRRATLHISPLCICQGRSPGCAFRIFKLAPSPDTGRLSQNQALSFPHRFSLQGRINEYPLRPTSLSDSEQAKSTSTSHRSKAD